MDADMKNGGNPRKRIAAIDLGTNSFHAVLVDIYPDGSFRTIDKLKEMVRLADEGMDKGLSDAAMQRGMEALSRIKTLCDHQGVEEILAYATSAIREAENGGEFIQRMIDELGLKALAISGRMEAELIGHAVQHAISINERPVLVADVGGGSVEFIIGNRERFFYLGSKKMGVSRMSSLFVQNDPPETEDIERLEAYYRKQIPDVAEAFAQHRCDTLVGSSGTMECIASMMAAFKNVNTKVTLNEFEYTAEEFKEFYNKFIKLKRKERLKVDGMDDKRVEMIVPGMVLVKFLIDLLHITTIKTSDEALREGMILRYIKKEMDDLKLMADFPDARRRSVFEMLRKFNWHEDHSRQVARLSLKLFDELQELHQLGDNERELLEYAAYLHDIGYHISRRKHHKHALYLIRHSDLKGFKEEEIETIANVARYHRRSTPKSRHKYYDRLDDDMKKVVRKLSGILRVADGLDRSHYQNVHQMHVDYDKDTVDVRIETESDPQLEIWGANRKNQLFEEEFDRKLQIKAVEQHVGALID